MSKTTSRMLLLISAFLFVFSFSAVSYAKPGAGEIQDQDEFVNMVNAQFPGMVEPISGQNSNPAPARQDEGLTWPQYLDKLEDLNKQLDKDEINEDQWMNQTQAARQEFLKGERARERGLKKDRSRPVDVRGVQITNGQITPINPVLVHQEP